MAFMKIIKDKAYYKRYQVKNRRRREGKTDYAARKNLIRQAKNKYNSAKYRLVVRFTNTRVIVAVISSTILGDKVLAQADSTELAKYGIKNGLTNYAAGYSTGLLVARRALQAVGLDKTFTGVEKADGEMYHVEEEESERRPLKVVLDVGLARTTIGARVFSALKGAVDGGLHVPHSNKRFPGFTAPESKGDDSEYNVEMHRERILGGHVCDYMELLKEEDPERFKKQFSRYIKAGIEGDDLEDLYLKAHERIRAKPSPAAKKKHVNKNTRKGKLLVTPSGKSFERREALNHKQRKGRVNQRLLAAQRTLAAQHALM